jgi:hypothetical protein
VPNSQPNRALKTGSVSLDARFASMATWALPRSVEKTAHRDDRRQMFENQRDNFRCPPRTQDLEPALYRHRLRKQFGKSARTRDATGPAKQRVASRITPKRALPIRSIGAPAFGPGISCKDQSGSTAPITVTLSNRRWMTTDVNVHIQESPKLFSKIRPGRIPQSRPYDRGRPVAARGAPPQFDGVQPQREAE